MDTIHLIRSYQTYNFIKNLKAKVNNLENLKVNNENLKEIENSFSNEEILVDIAVALLNYIWPTSQENIRNCTLKRFIKHTMKLSNSTISIYISAIYYLLNLKDNGKFNNLLQRIQLEIENTKQEQGFINNGNLYERCCNCCGAYISCYRSDTVVCKCRLFLVSLVLACKFGQDKNYSNKAWSKISGFPVENINYIERFFLKLTDYRLYINIESYQAFVTLISNHIISMKKQKQKLHCKELLNLSKVNTVDVSNVHEWKKNLEKKSELIKRIKQLEIIKQAKARYQTIHNSNCKSSLISTNITGVNEISHATVSKNSQIDVNYVLNNKSTDAKPFIPENIQKLSPVENKHTNINGTYLRADTHAKSISTDVNNKPLNVAAISPISPSGLPISSVNANSNTKINSNINVILNNINMRNSENYIPSQQNLAVPMMNYTQLPCSVNNVNKSEKQNHQFVGLQSSTQSNQLTLENFSSFIKFYSCINEKLSTSNESIIKATSSYKALNCALNLAASKRIQDAIKLLNHLIFGTMDICKEIISLALKGQKKNALIYIYLLTPSEIQFYNKNLKAPSLKSLTPQDVLSVVSILLNCVHKRSTTNNGIKNDLLANLGQQNQVNNSSSQNLLLKFIQNINYSLSHN